MLKINLGLIEGTEVPEETILALSAEVEVIGK